MGVGRRQEAVRRALGRGREHRRRLAAYAARRGGDRSGATYGFSQLFGEWRGGPVIISALGIAAAALVFARRLRQEPLPA